MAEVGTETGTVTSEAGQVKIEAGPLVTVEVGETEIEDGTEETGETGVGGT